MLGFSMQPFFPWPFDMAVLRNTLRRETAIKVSMSTLQEGSTMETTKE